MSHIPITGGSRRLGLYLTEAFLNQGWDVSVITRKVSNQLAALKTKSLTLYQADYEDNAAIEKLCNEISTLPLDAVVHNASIFQADSAELQSDLFEKMFTVQMKLPFQLNQLLSENLKRSTNANIIHISDIYADQPKPEYAMYSATKAGAENLMKSFACSLAPDIRVNAIAPGALEFLPEHSDDQQNAILEQSLLKEKAGFKPILSTINYIIENTFITGTTITVDGGRTLAR